MRLPSRSRTYKAIMARSQEIKAMTDNHKRTSWRCPECGKRFGTWDDEPPVSPCCNATIPQECIDALVTLENEIRRRFSNTPTPGGGDAEK